MSKWLSIKIAPRDGTEILITDGRYIMHASYIVESPRIAAFCWRAVGVDEFYLSENDYRHWMPLPEPPNAPAP